MSSGQTTLHLVEGKDLIAMDLNGYSDPFVNVMIIKPGDKPRQIYQTETIDETLNPKWDESVRIKESYLRDEGIIFRFDMYDEDVFKHDYMGYVEIPITDMKKSFDTWFPLLPKPGKKASTVSGSINIKCVVPSDSVDTDALVAEATLKIKSGDDKGAIPLLQQASECGNLVAQRDLGLLLKEGRGADKDPLEAKKLLTRASKNGDAVSENCLGYMKQHGIAGTKKGIEAKEHYEISANADNPAGMYNLGYAYFCGLGVQQDLEKAREWFGAASMIQYPPAVNNLGFCMQFGLGGDKNIEEALRLYTQASDVKYPPAMVNLGQYYQFVEGDQEGEKKAKELYEAALELDNKNAQAWFCLAVCLELGIGGEKNEEQAKKAYGAAETYGEPDGRKALDRIANGPLKKKSDKKKFGTRKERSTSKKGHRRTRSIGVDKKADTIAIKAESPQTTRK